MILFRNSIVLLLRIHTHQRSRRTLQTLSAATMSAASFDRGGFLQGSFHNLNDSFPRRASLRQAIILRHLRKYLVAMIIHLFLLMMVSSLSDEWQGEGVYTP